MLLPYDKPICSFIHTRLKALWLPGSFRFLVISELAWPMAAINATHAYHLLLTGINKNLIWGNYEKPTHYAIWFMFSHVAIIGLIAKKPSFPELYSLGFDCRPSQSPSPSPYVWSSNCLKTDTHICFMTPQASVWAVAWCTLESSMAARNGSLAITRNLILSYQEGSPEIPPPLLPPCNLFLMVSLAHLLPLLQQNLPRMLGSNSCQCLIYTKSKSSVTCAWLVGAVCLTTANKWTLNHWRFLIKKGIFYKGYPMKFCRDIKNTGQKELGKLSVW